MNIFKSDTILNADSVEFCPYENLQNLLLCGTYKLKESIESAADVQRETSENISSPQIRNGGVIVYSLDLDDSSGPSLRKCSNKDMCGVLDIKWPQSQIQNEPVFGLVDAEGYVQIQKLDPNGYSIETLAKCELSTSSLGLSLGWSGFSHSTNKLLTASDSLGHVTVFDVNKEMNQVSKWKAHDYEAWITAFDNFNSNVVYSGGDDAKFKVWDLRDLSQPTVCSKRHTMGVCSIQGHPFTDHIIATGSYDENLIIWDNRNFKDQLNNIALGGGIWRIKWDPFCGNSILTATMYNGTHIVDCREMGVNPLTIAAEYKDHNLAYGADWCRIKTAKFSDTKTPKAEEKLSVLISTCSFYDHSLHIWEWNYD